MRAEAVAVPRVFGVFDHQAPVLGNLETSEPSHELRAARAEQPVRGGGRTHRPEPGHAETPPADGQTEEQGMEKASEDEGATLKSVEI